MEKIGKLANQEILNLRRNSSIVKTDVDSLISMDDEKLCEEYDNICPILCSTIKGAVGENLIGPRLLIYGILFKSRYARTRGCLITHRNDQLLIAAGAKKKSFKWFNKVGFTNSYTNALNKNKQLAVDHDKIVIEWKQAIENAAKSICDLFPDSTPEEFKKELKERILAEYQLIGDNIDFEQIVRHQSKLNQNKSIHWFHYMAVKERFHSSQGNFFEDWRHKLH